jgi:3-deoxy-D-manno-octulosonic-acid transferase
MMGRRLLWQQAYNILVIPLLWLGFHAAAWFDSKVRRGIQGRERLFDALREKTTGLPTGRRVWVHSSSMGEFEQAKPIIASLKRGDSDLAVMATFFSPSGYDHSLKYPLADLVSYLPFDSQNQAEKFLDLTRPDVAVFVRYDVWPNHLWSLEKRGIPAIIANATLHRLSLRRLPIVKSFHRAMYNALDRILTVSSIDAETFRTFSLSKPLIEPVGDTRFDQVVTRSAEARLHPVLPDRITRGRNILVAGSCWPEDDAVLIPAMSRLASSRPETLFIHVPHEPTEQHVLRLEREMRGRVTFCRYSSLDSFTNENVLIVDTVGKLLSLYSVASIAYIGGSFRSGIHNVLEAAVYGIPVLFGPHHYNSQEPLMLIDRGGGIVVEDSEISQSPFRR